MTRLAGRPQQGRMAFHPAVRLLSLAAPFALRMALAVLLGVATIGSSIGLMTTSAYVIARAALHPSIADLQVAIVGVRFFGIARGVARYLERLVAHDATFRLLARLRVWFYRALEPLAPARLMQYRSGDLLARIGSDVDTLQDYFLRAIAPPAVAVLVAAMAAALVASFHPRLAVPLLVGLLLAGLGVPLLARTLGRRTGRRLVQLRSDLNGILVDAIQGLAVLLAFGREAYTLDQVRALDRDLGHLQARAASAGGLSSALTGLLTNLTTLALLAVAIPLVTAGPLDGVLLALLTLAVVSSFEAVLPLAPAFQTLESCLEAGRRLFEIVDAEPAVCDPPAPLPLPAFAEAAGLCRDWCLRVENLHFSYPEKAPGLCPETAPGPCPETAPGLSPETAPGVCTPAVPPPKWQRDSAALDGISFDLPPGANLAVVGPSGSGKSTLVSLLLRFWDAPPGSIRLGGPEWLLGGPEWPLGGVDVRQVRQDDWRRQVGVVSQHTHLFNATVRDNLLLARPEAGEADLIEAARRAHIHDFVQSLPQGYDTWIGEQGLHLSGGQRQRLAIARALLKDASLLILDEPTANLDALTERDVLDSLRELMAGRTALIVTHRLVGLEFVDEILVLKSGRLVERGRHHDLLLAGGLYKRMWSLQTQAV